MSNDDDKVTKLPIPEGPFRDPQLQKVLQAVDLAVDTAVRNEESASDELVVRDEPAFRRRFGFVVSKADRGRLLALKQRLDLTDQEVTVLKRSGSLDFDDDAVRIWVPLVFPIWGVIQILALSLVMLLGFLAIDAFPFSWKGFATVTAMEFGCLALVWGLNQQYIVPWRIKRRTTRRFGMG